MKARTLLLSTAAVMTLSGGAYAADMGLPYKVEPIPYAPWEGGYIGGNIGVARMDATCSPTAQSYGYYGCGSYYGTASASASDTNFIAGAQAGWDWQNRSFVYGVAADWDWTNLRHATQGFDFGYYGPFQAKVDWLASFRGRAGLDVENTMVYFTGGLALGGISAKSGLDYGAETFSAINQARVGWVAGLGIEHKFDPHWSAFAEVLYYDFGNMKGPMTVYAGENYQNEYNFNAIAARLGFNYRF